MASRWQRWYQHDIDAWQGSATVQTLSDAGYRAFHNLIQEQFQQPNGRLLNDDVMLAKQSRMGARWLAPRDGMPTIAAEVRECMEVDEDGYIFSPRQLATWEHAHKKHIDHVGHLETARAAKAARISTGSSIDRATDSSTDSSIDRATDSLIDNSIPRAESREKRERVESREKDDSAETSSAPPAAFLPLVDGTEFPISQERFDAWVVAFPGVDIAQHIVRMRVWLDANATRRVTRRGALAFANKWLSREQDNGAHRRGGNANAGNRSQQRTDGNIEAARAATSSILGKVVDWPGRSAPGGGESTDAGALFGETV